MRILSSKTHAFALLGACLLLVSVHTATAQVPAAPKAPAASAADDYVPTLTFDVVSIHENPPNTGNGVHVGVISPPHTSKFISANLTATSLLQMAYGFGTPVVGGPDWIKEISYTVDAKCDPSVDAQLAKMTDDQSKAEKMHMLQAMLADRFHLNFHMETRDSAVYVVTVAKGGSKMHETKIEDGQPSASSRGVDVQAHGGQHGLQFDVKTASMRAMVGILSSQVEAPVIDRTGLPGYYDFTLQFGRDWSANDPDSWPNLPIAVQQQLGLKLDSTHEPVPVMIIDHIEKPSAN
jgi:uncharacterized protein (TIGR03435 family)